MSFEDALRRIAEKNKAEAKATRRAWALAELERIAALTPRERLRDFVLTQTYSHDMPAEVDPDSPFGIRDIPEDEYPAVADREIDAFAAHILREAAEKIRAHSWRECCGAGCSDLAADAADLIDPDKED